MFRSHNFSAGPSILPTEVLQKAQAELLDYKGTGSSIMELSHRGPEYIEVDAQATSRLKSLMGLGDDFEVLFLQGGASTQFMMVPYNFLAEGKTANYLNTGTWSKKAIKEAKIFGKVHVGFSSEEENFGRVPRNEEITHVEGAEYLHFTSNNTIFGTQYRNEPESNGVPLVCDASSDFLSREVDVKRYGMIYAGAQKNAGPAGVTIVIIRKDFLAKARTENVSTILSYPTHVGTMFNTPPVFGVYFFNLVLEWIEKQGGIKAVEKVNEAKAAQLYTEIDKDDFYRGTAEAASRSRMNVTFRLPSEDLEKKFVKEAAALHLDGLKGHRSVGGIRASIYNALPRESVDTLVSFMVDFRAKNG
ncbi:MAG: 3-phosphoserine/phosphohydroxythreonine transaminase [Bacteroidetes bacterium]|nr:3-phosphoserine/phosphohydroxythreonine transaminase [Bacteroidota bacterium]MCH8523401.1 3-phosphoserine/phosphohydroxythreonine transaminase [Balneolales bacterium]